MLLAQYQRSQKRPIIRWTGRKNLTNKSKTGLTDLEREDFVKYGARWRRSIRPHLKARAAALVV
jgi:hypothetical protein